jgi:hypothetical protein
MSWVVDDLIFQSPFGPDFLNVGESSTLSGNFPLLLSIADFKLELFCLSGTDFDKNLGIGKDDAAGEARNVGPA